MSALSVAASCMIFWSAIVAEIANEHLWRQSYLQMLSCEPLKQKGEWCEWGNWGDCEKRTCTRLRRRSCACPAPADWEDGACPAILEQDDIILNDEIQQHTRFVRMNKVGKCLLPFFVKGTYYGDCAVLPGNKKPVCPANDKKGKRKYDVCVPGDYGMEERDVGPCDDWRLAQGWSQGDVPEDSRRVINAFSPYGKQCYNPKIYSSKASALDACPPKLYLSQSGQRNIFSNMNNLAFSLESCKFTCAIDPRCMAIEFSEGYFCTLLDALDSEKLVRQIGTTLYVKPRECSQAQAYVDPVKYPYAAALEEFNANLS